MCLNQGSWYRAARGSGGLAPPKSGLMSLECRGAHVSGSDPHHTSASFQTAFEVRVGEKSSFTINGSVSTRTLYKPLISLNVGLLSQPHHALSR
jgi:hypothetical protein